MHKEVSYRQTDWDEAEKEQQRVESRNKGKHINLNNQLKVVKCHCETRRSQTETTYKQNTYYTRLNINSQQLRLQQNEEEKYLLERD